MELWGCGSWLRPGGVHRPRFSLLLARASPPAQTMKSWDPSLLTGLLCWLPCPRGRLSGSPPTTNQRLQVLIAGWVLRESQSSAFISVGRWGGRDAGSLLSTEIVTGIELERLQVSPLLIKRSFFLYQAGLFFWKGIHFKKGYKEEGS